MQDRKYPIGKFKMPSDFHLNEVNQWIDQIQKLPDSFEKAANSLTAEALEQAYRPGGWTGRQVIHHVADSHLNAYIRFKWVLTEDNPTIKAYDEDRWAQLPDSKMGDIKVPLQLLRAIHARWHQLLTTMDMDDFRKHYHHPENKRNFPLGAVCKLYAWHGQHHQAHLELLKDTTA